MFTIPRGDKGEPGKDGTGGTGTVTGVKGTGSYCVNSDNRAIPVITFDMSLLPALP